MELSFWRSNPGLFCLKYVWESCWDWLLQAILKACCFIHAKVWFSLFWRYRFAINFTNLFEFLSFLRALLQLSTISPTIQSNVSTSIRWIPWKVVLFPLQVLSEFFDYGIAHFHKIPIFLQDWSDRQSSISKFNLIFRRWLKLH